MIYSLQVTFPPTIFFKIFTHRSVVDMCSFSPRDYTAMSERKMLCKDVHNNKDSRAIPIDKEKWYKRIESNGWRPLSDKVSVITPFLIFTVTTLSYIIFCFIILFFSLLFLLMRLFVPM